MFKVLGWIIKASLFTAIILVASHLVRWNGRTVSDQVRSTLSSAERSAPLKTARKKSEVLLEDAKDAAERALKAARSTTSEKAEIPEQDKEELQALIDDEKKSF